MRVTYERKVWATKTSYRLKESECEHDAQLCKTNDGVNQEIAWLKNLLSTALKMNELLDIEKDRMG